MSIFVVVLIFNATLLLLFLTVGTLVLDNLKFGAFTLGYFLFYIALVSVLLKS